MIRTSAGLVLLAFPLAASAQFPPPPTKLTLHPAAAPVPALKYKLLPEQRDLTPGNAVQLYYRAFSPDAWGGFQRDPKIYEKLVEGARAPFKDLAAGRELKWLRNVWPLREADRAARRQYCEWEFTPRLREEGIGILLPELQTFRVYAQMLAVRARLEMADGRFDQAARSFQTGFALARHVGDGPTLIQSLVGIAIGSLTLDQVETWIQQPGTPNLYWSLTDLPRPFIDLRRGLEGEKVVTDNIFGELRDMLRGAKLVPWHAPNAQEKIRLLNGLGHQPSDNLLGDPFLGFLGAGKLYLEAKEFLIGQGRPAVEVEALPVFQVMLLHQVATYDRFFDELVKWQNLPYPIALAGIAQAENALKAEAQRIGGSANSLAAMLLPAIGRVQFAAVRTHRRIDALRIVEALRIYAAAHGGRLPDTLADVTEVPIPPDLVTGKPFEYKREADRATLTGPPPSGEQPHSGNVVNYELTIAR